MATSVLQATAVRRVSSRTERAFFCAVAVLIATAVFLGFARTYFLAGAFWAKLPSVMVHLHGALFTLWIALLVAQIALVATRRTCWHMRLGIAGMFLAYADAAKSHSD